MWSMSYPAGFPSSGEIIISFPALYCIGLLTLSGQQQLERSGLSRKLVSTKRRPEYQQSRK